MLELTRSKLVFSAALLLTAIAIIFYANAGMNNSGIYIHVNGHAFEQHGTQVNEAFNCIKKNGTKVVLSEKISRNLHWICIDPFTLTVYDIITSYLTKTVDHPAGEAKLVTAYSPESNTLGKTMFDWYLEHLQITKEAIIVNLRGFPGSMFFGP